MISYLSGTVLFINEKTLCLDIGGVGYEIYTPLQTLLSLKVGTSTSFYIYSHVREDQFTLFGFTSKDEKFVFEKLMGVSGIGPKGALGILSVHSPASIASAVSHNDIALLSHSPGIGKKTAEKMIIELRGKLDDYLGVATSDSLFRCALRLRHSVIIPKMYMMRFLLLKTLQKALKTLFVKH